MQEITPEAAHQRDDPTPGPVRDLVGYGAEPPRVEWPDGARVALQFVVNYEEGAEYSQPAGDGRNEAVAETARSLPPHFRDLHVESVFEYGSRAGVWRLLRLFERFDIRCTFFAAAVALERNPAVARAACAAGHEVAAHGWRWSDQWLLSRGEERTHIEAAVRSIEQTCGKRPEGWYSRYGPSVHTRELLVEIGGFRYDADAYNDDLPYFVDVAGHRHLVVPYTAVLNDMRFALQGYSSPRDFYETCAQALDYLAEEGKTHPRMLSVGLHPRLVGQPGRASALQALIEHAQRRGDVWFARRIDIAELWWNRFGTGRTYGQA
jgi:peptidoglycan/xylan/chitin deacetylase (PgdA/CDA1 family)